MSVKKYFIDLIEGSLPYTAFIEIYKNENTLNDYLTNLIDDNMKNNKDEFLKTYAEIKFHFIDLNYKEESDPRLIEISKIMDQNSKNSLMERFEKHNIIINNVMKKAVLKNELLINTRSSVYIGIASVLTAAKVKVELKSPHLQDSSLVMHSFLDKVIGGKEIDTFVDNEILSKTTHIEDFGKRLKEVKKLTKQYFKDTNGKLPSVEWELEGIWPLKDGKPMLYSEIKKITEDK